LLSVNHIFFAGYGIFKLHSVLFLTFHLRDNFISHAGDGEKMMRRVCIFLTNYR